jgi:hypothetical protein
VDDQKRKEGGWKKRIAHETGEFLWVFSYLALFFWVFSTYRELILHQLHFGYFILGTGLVNALVLSKIILLGQYVHVGRRHEKRPLIVSTLYKAALFALLVAAFHLVEEAFHRFLHGHTLVASIHEISSLDMVETLVRILVVFCVFIPFFALAETRRVLGDTKLFDLFFRRRTAELSQPELGQHDPG